MRKKKLEFNFTNKGLNVLDGLVKDTDTNRPTVIRNALITYEYFIRKKSEGFKIKLIKEREEIIL